MAKPDGQMCGSNCLFENFDRLICSAGPGRNYGMNKYIERWRWPGVGGCYFESYSRATRIKHKGALDFYGKGNPRTLTSRQGLFSHISGFLGGIGGSFGDIKLFCAGGSGVFHKIASCSPEKPSCNTKDNSKNCNDPLAIDMDEFADAKARTNQKFIETGDLFLKGIAAIIFILIGQALLDRWGRPRNPRNKSDCGENIKPRKVISSYRSKQASNILQAYTFNL